MSRFGKLAIEIPSGVTVTSTGAKLTVSGPKGELVRDIPRSVEVVVDGASATIKAKSENKESRTNQGTTRAHLINMVKGVTDGWSKQLEIVGAGYRAEVQGQKLVMQIGFSHPVIITAPEGVTFVVDKSTVKVSGTDKEIIGHISSLIRGSRPPEPYKGTGIKYSDEIIRRKAGKQAAK
jgi:large subunit ribosomal protein L6